MVQIHPPIPGASIPRTLSRYVLIAVVLLAGFRVQSADKFYPDDPIKAFPKPLPVKQLPSRKTGALYDFTKQSFSRYAPPELPARGVNTLGDVPDSAWFTNRHGSRRMSRQELQQGPAIEPPPAPPFVVVGLKTEGITRGFRMNDAKGRLYWVKPDPISNPEMATAADVVGSRFFYALGYYTPQNHLVYLKRTDLKVSPGAAVEGLGGKERPMFERDLDDLLRMVPRRKDRTYRMMASLAVEGKTIGHFRFEGTRPDDPNDTIPHQDRRDLRGLRVFCAWLNHTDAKALNSLDTLVEEDGIRFVRHYLIDFGAILGSDSDMPKNARFGNEYIMPTTGQALTRIVSLGLDVRPWESANYGHSKAVGRFESRIFDPEKWKSNYPNPAFALCLPDDEYWAAKQIMAFSSEDIRAIVETGDYSNPAAVEYLVQTLIERRDKIAKVYFSKVLPLDHFAVNGDRLVFDDLAVTYHLLSARDYAVQWSEFDNQKNRNTPLDGQTSFTLPPQIQSATEGSYFAASIHSADPQKMVTVYLRKTAGPMEVVGIDRIW